MAPSTVHYILTNISYTGDMIWQKSYATDTIPFRQVRNHGEKPQYFVENCHPAIVSREEFQRVQELMASRREQFTAGGKTAGICVQRPHFLWGVRLHVPPKDLQWKAVLGLPPA